MKFSRQRELIREEVVRTDSHPTAEMVYDRLKESNPKLSLGTVYRNLNFLSELGEIKKIPLPNSKDRFDGTITPHYHVICQNCGKVCDVSLNQMPDIEKELGKQSDYEITTCELVVYGLCPDCKNKYN